jgi:hypothetical protein
MSTSDLFSILEAGGARYSAHTFDFSIDLNAILERLSPFARFFFVYGNEEKGKQLEIEQIYLPRWSEDPALLEQFEKLTNDQQLEVLCLFTAPIHESRHHFDMVLTPFGARFYFTLAQEYLDFQLFSPCLLQNQELIQPGPLVELHERLSKTERTIPAEWKERWDAVSRQILTFGACIDFRGIHPSVKSIARDPTDTHRFLGMEMERVAINGLAVSFSPKTRPDWYMRASALLEGRAVIASLSWMIWNLEGYEELGPLLSRYVSTLYPPDENYDYRFLLDIAAAWMGCSTVEDAFQKFDFTTIRNILFMVDSAAWFGLHAPIKVRDGQVMNENLFFRFIYALQEMEKAYDRGYDGSPLDLLSEIEVLERAKTWNLFTFDQAITNSVNFLRQALENTLPQIWQTEIKEHFREIFHQLEVALSIRLKEGGYVTPLAAAYRGNLLLYLEKEYRFLTKPYSPKAWVKDWFEFRNESFFTADSVSRRRRRLAGQFGLAEVVISCECGVMISAAVPKWRTHHSIECGRCKKVIKLGQGDLTWIAVPDEEEE